MNGTCSDFSAVISGVPQGSVLWPLIYINDVNDLPLTVNSKLQMIIIESVDSICSSTDTQ